MNSPNTSLFKDKEFTRKLTRLIIPIALQNLLLSAVAVCDTLMLGQFEQNAMTAVSYAAQIQFIQNLLVSASVGAGTVLGAQYWGKNDRRTVSEIFNIMMKIAVAVSLVFGVFCIVRPDILLHIYLSDEAIIEIGSQYLRIAGFSYILTGFTQSYLGMMKVTEHASMSTMISGGAVAVNIVLNAVLIFGLFGAPVMGARGAAIATLTARIVELIWSVILSRRPGYVSPQWSRMLSWSPELGKDFLKMMVPYLLGGLSWGVGFSMYSAVLGHLGGDVAAANALANTIRDLVSCLCFGAGTAVGIVIGNELGAGELEKAKETGIKIKKVAWLAGFISTAVVLIIMPFVFKFYTKLTDTARQYLFWMLLLVAFYMIGRCLNTIVDGVFYAGGDGIFDTQSVIVSMWCFALPLSWLGGYVFHWPVMAVYICTCLDEFIKLPWVFAHYRKYKWLKNLTRDEVSAESAGEK